MASNSNGVSDEDGDRSDWIEIYNPSQSAIDLSDWYLTDDISDLTKWKFPAAIIPANEHILIYASSKNRAVSGSELHTNFKLSKSGEDLALVKPDGITVTSQFAAYPEQFTDVSYGTTLPTQITSLVASGATAKALIPSNGSLGDSWKGGSEPFADGAWLTGTTGVGYDYSGLIGLDVGGMEGNNASVFIRIPFTVTDASKVLSMRLKMRYEDGFVMYINGTRVEDQNAPLENALTWSSIASTEHSDAQAVQPVDFSLNDDISVLQTGSNILSIQALNRSANSSDLLVLPELEVTEVTNSSAGMTGFFSVPTPDALNGGNDTLNIPQNVNFAPASQTFVGSLSVMLSGNLAGQTIRYTTDGSKPTTSSPVYSGAITVLSTQVIRAAVFTSNGTAGSTNSGSYEQLTNSGARKLDHFQSTIPVVVVQRQSNSALSDTNLQAAHLKVYEPDGNTGLTSFNVTPTMESRCGFRLRGSSSQTFPKKPYALELWDENDQDKSASILGMSAESDWVLYAPYQFDRAFMRNAFIYEMSRRFGRWAPRTRFVEVFVNDEGSKLNTYDYVGVYVLMEKIKVDENRLDITSLETEDILPPASTGGYIFKIDRQDPGEFSWHTTRGIPSLGLNYLVHVTPEAGKSQVEQRNYLEGYVQNFEDSLYTESSNGFSSRNYFDYIDEHAWVDHNILNAFMKNVDALRLSGFFHKDRNQGIAAGPVWDFDRSADSHDHRDQAVNTWNGTGDGTKYFEYDWWDKLFDDVEIRQLWIDRWQELRKDVFTDTEIQALIDSMKDELDDDSPHDNQTPAERNFSLPEQFSPPAPGNGGTHAAEVSHLRTWLVNRAQWIDSQFVNQPGFVTPSGVVSAGTSISINVPSGTSVYYTTDGSDPRAEGGGVSPSASLYAGAIAVASTTEIRMRAFDTTPPGVEVKIRSNWSGITRSLYLVNESYAVAGQVIVREVNYHPFSPTDTEIASIAGIEADDFEWIELENISSQTVNLEGVQFKADLPVNETTLGHYTLAPGSRVLVVSNIAAFRIRYGTSFDSMIAGQWLGGKLSNKGELISLLTRNGSSLIEFSYSDNSNWPGRADGKGSSLEYTGTTYSQVDYENPLHWRSSNEVHGSPTVVGAGPDNRIVVNEVLTHTDLPQTDSIELYNTTANAIDISGWYLSDANSANTETEYRKFKIPNGTTIPAGGYLVFNESDFNSGAGALATDFSLNGAEGDDVWLVSASAGGELQRFVNHVEFGAALNGESLGRWPNATGDFFPMASNSLADANNQPRSGPVIITEVHYDPTGTDDDLEFVEIANTSGSTASLDQWTLRGAVDFNFGPSHAIPSGGLIVMVPFDPADISQSNQFRSTYGISQSVTLVGPWSPGDLLDNTEGDSIRLRRADDSPAGQPNFYPQVQEDEVSYKVGGSWPIATGGLSLNRIGPRLWGNLSENWELVFPSPGDSQVGYHTWRRKHFPTLGSGSNDDDDPDRDGIKNIEEYARGLDPMSPNGSVMPLGEISIVGSDLVYRFISLTIKADVVLTVEKSTDLINWSDVSDSLVSLSGGQLQRETILSLSSNVPNHFMRIHMRVAP